MKKQLFWLFAGLTSFAVSLVVLAPLPVIAQQLEKRQPGVKFAGVSGNLLKGQVQRLTIPQAVINNLNWTFAPRKLLSGYLAADMEAEVKTAEVKGQCGISIMQTLHCSPFRAELDAANIGELAPQGQQIPVKLQGTIIANLDDITWDQQTMPIANGRLLWDDGKIDTPIKLDLGGRYQADIEGDQDGKALAVELFSEATTLVLDGDISVEPEGKFEMEIFVKPAGDADPAVGAALELVGAPQTDGSIRIQQKGTIPLAQASQQEAE